MIEIIKREIINKLNQDVQALTWEEQVVLYERLEAILETKRMSLEVEIKEQRERLDG